MNFRKMIAKASKQVADGIRQNRIKLTKHDVVEYNQFDNCGPGCALGYIAASMGCNPQDAYKIFNVAKIRSNSIVNFNDSGDEDNLLKRLDFIAHKYAR